MTSQDVCIPVGTDDDVAVGSWSVPQRARGAVVFAHGSGSSRFSARNRHVADLLGSGGFATLLLDLLTPREEGIDDITGEFRFDIPFLAHRLAVAIDWLAHSAPELPIGLFGASTGAAAALVAAVARPQLVRAVVSRGGRPDLAAEALPRVQAPTLLLVGGLDDVVLKLNEEAHASLRCPKQLVVIPGATHLFEEPGTLDEVAHQARAWFERHLVPAPLHAPGPS